MKNPCAPLLRNALALLPAAVLALSCGSTEPQSMADLPPEMNRSVVVTVGDPTLKIPAGARFGWMPESIRYFGDPRLDGVMLNSLLQEAIQSELSKKGFAFTTPEDCDFKLGYVAALESAISDRDVNALYGISAGHVPRESMSREYEKGTLIIDVIHPETRRCVWRGSLQANIGFDLPEKIRRQRIALAIKQLFANFPP